MTIRLRTIVSKDTNRDRGSLPPGDERNAMNQILPSAQHVLDKLEAHVARTDAIEEIRTTQRRAICAVLQNGDDVIAAGTISYCAERLRELGAS
jgi:hypothetical protein